MVNLTGVVFDNYLLSGFLYASDHSQEILWIQFLSTFHFLGCQLMQRTTVIPGPSVVLLSFWSVILRVREANSPFLSLLYWGATGSKHVNSSEPVMWYLSGMLLSLPIFLVVSVVEFVQAKNCLHDTCQFVCLDDAIIGIL